MTQYPLRLPDDIMAQAQTAAREDEITVDQMLVSFIADGLSQRRGVKMIRDRAARADMDAAFTILDAVPDVAPDIGDEMPSVEADRS